MQLNIYDKFPLNEFSNPSVEMLCNIKYIFGDSKVRLKIKTGKIFIML